ncbi:galanin receptor type 2 [Anguilla anguilla]|uniref:galanin receptor type 2 n=1 Tax=Anguilla anguilla TaxID=7936 RepID=UPI0015ADD821|nr:galanin receptor type 2 [Anguilla anguilla]
MADGEALLGNGTGEGHVEQVLLPVLDSLIMITGVFGHSLVIVILTGRCRRAGGRPPPGTDILLLALSAADLLLLACLPFHATATAMGRWPFGEPLCKVISFTGVACSSASVFTLAALAVTRYLTVVRPTSAYLWRRQGRLQLVVAALWLPAIALAAPQLAFRVVGTTGPLYCFAFLADIRQQLAYSISHFLLAFALPLAVIVLTYARIYGFLARRRKCSAPETRLELYQKRVTRTSALLVLAFTLCWLPSYVLMFCLVGGTADGSGHLEALSVFARMAGASSTIANPVLYVFLSSKFRKDLQELFQVRGPRRSCCSELRAKEPARSPEPEVELGQPPPTALSQPESRIMGLPPGFKQEYPAGGS